MDLFQAGFPKGKRRVDNIFVTKRPVSVYLRVNHVEYDWCFLGFHKAFDPLDMQTSLGVKNEKRMGDSMARYA
jgi:hypothetical protein